PHFAGARQFVEGALKSGGRVLVHCNDGISRSPAFAVAYVMETVCLDYQSAFHFVLQRRFCVNPNEGFKLQLKEYEPIFSAKAQLSNTGVMDAERLRLKRRTAPSDESERLAKQKQFAFRL
ncbi:MAG: dual specificity phosphatase, partial [Olpidium bornovanus]